MTDSRTFKDGFLEGWTLIRGKNAIKPVIPIQPITPIGKTPYEVGLLLGMERAKQ